MKAKSLVTSILAAALLGTASAAANAEESNGTVTVVAEKTTIGQGFVFKPVQVELRDGDTGIDVVKRAAELSGVEVVYSDTGYGPYITAFSDTDSENGVYLPDEIAAVVTELSDRTAPGYLSAYDYTAESGWSYFVNDEYAMTGIGDYSPADGDVIRFSFSVYGYGADLGVDNSSWGGAAALITPAAKADLTRLCAQFDSEDETEIYKYTNAMEVLAYYGATQQEVDEAYAVLASDSTVDVESGEGTDNSSDEPAGDSAGKGSPETGVEGAAAIGAIAILAGMALAVSKRRA
ncbi:MAG: DUF4430 domain-containing protein [Oscillospiraceae bacterium]